MFNTMHLMFMQQYTEQWNAPDLVAERIRALGFPAPGSYTEFVKLASIKKPADASQLRGTSPHLS
jgi:starvation-inducible DNA-binding protein